jgi:glucose/arabinose dehydrogenase
MKKIIFFLIFLSLASSACAPKPQPVVITQIIAPTSMNSPTASAPISTPAVPTSAPTKPTPTGWKVETVVEGLMIPWSIVFTSPDRMLVTERTGTVREIAKGVLNPNPVFTFTDVAAKSESGLLGMTLDPQYASNHYIYICYSFLAGNGEDNRVVRMLDNGTSLSRDVVIIDTLPAAVEHAGCALRFGPDGKLYITNGDSLKPSSAQDLKSLSGKILRINADGTIPADNPFPGSPVWSFGHRNPQGIDWQPGTGLMYETEHGPSGFDGPRGGDEINLIQPGGNYGWPLVSHDQTGPGLISPLIQFTPAYAPASLTFYNSDVLPMFKGAMFFGALVGEGVVKVVISPTDPNKIASVDRIITNVGRVRNIVQGPDGYIYFSTSNRDGRGTVHPGDDHIYRIVPVY